MSGGKRFPAFCGTCVRSGASRRSNSAAGYADFLDSRAAFVSQKKLYEYVKQRMGMSFPVHFADDQFIASLNIAKLRVYAACLSDLALWMAAR